MRIARHREESLPQLPAAMGACQHALGSQHRKAFNLRWVWVWVKVGVGVLVGVKVGVRMRVRVVVRTKIAKLMSNGEAPFMRLH